RPAPDGFLEGRIHGATALRVAVPEARAAVLRHDQRARAREADDGRGEERPGGRLHVVLLEEPRPDRLADPRRGDGGGEREEPGVVAPGGREARDGERHLQLRDGVVGASDDRLLRGGERGGGGT